MKSNIKIKGGRAINSSNTIQSRTFFIQPDRPPQVQSNPVDQFPLDEPLERFLSAA